MDLSVFLIVGVPDIEIICHPGILALRIVCDFFRRYLLFTNAYSAAREVIACDMLYIWRLQLIFGLGVQRDTYGDSHCLVPPIHLSFRTGLPVVRITGTVSEIDQSAEPFGLIPLLPA